ncbi:MAG: ANTAR domain-containing response regulator [Mangrovicoccus sp.]
MGQRLKIAIVEKDVDRSRMIVDGLREAGDFDVIVLGDETSMARKLAEIDPDVVLIDIANPSRDTLESMSLASGAKERPVAMFVDRTDNETTRAAIEAGLSAYVVDGLTPARIKPVLDAAIARFNMVSQMRSELEAAKTALVERKTIDRAKGLLMKARGITEDEAYALLRKAAMDQGKKLVDVAQALVTAAELLK